MRKGSRPSTISSLFNKRAEVLLIGKRRNMAVLMQIESSVLILGMGLDYKYSIPPPSELIWKLLE